MAKIFVGADHAGFKLKEKMKAFLKILGYEIIDVGNLKYDKNDDYPDFGFKVAKKTIANRAKGIVFCGSAEGVCIVANKVKGARAVAIRDTTLAKLSREHNDANVLCLAGGETRNKIKGLGLSEKKTKEIITIWLKTKFSSAKRHHRRVRKISRYDSRMFK